MAGLKPLLKDIADAIRAKSGTTSVIPASEFEDKISKLYVVSNEDEVYLDGSLHAESGDKYYITSQAYIEYDTRATFDGKTLTVPIKMVLNCNGGGEEGSFNIIVSF